MQDGTETKKTICSISKSIDVWGMYSEILEQWRILTRIDIVVLDTFAGYPSGLKDLMGTFLNDIVLQVLSGETSAQYPTARQAEGIAAASKGVRFGPAPLRKLSSYRLNGKMEKSPRKLLSFPPSLSCGDLRKSQVVVSSVFTELCRRTFGYGMEITGDAEAQMLPTLLENHVAAMGWSLRVSRTFTGYIHFWITVTNLAELNTNHLTVCAVW